MPVSDASKKKFLRLSMALEEPRVLNWEEPGRPEEIQKVNNTEVKVTWGSESNILFLGNLRIQREGIAQKEGLRLQAVGRWEFLNSHVFTKAGTSRVRFNDENRGQTIKTCGEILKEILDRAITGGLDISYTQAQLDAMTVEPPPLTFQGSYFTHAIREVLKWQGTHSAYIDPDGYEFTLVDFDNLTEKSVYLGELKTPVGTLVSDQYNVKSCDLALSLAGCKTECIFEGGEELHQVPEEELTIDDYVTFGGENFPYIFKSLHSLWFKNLINDDGSMTETPPQINFKVIRKDIETGQEREVRKSLSIHVDYDAGKVKVLPVYYKAVAYISGVQTITKEYAYYATEVKVTYAYRGDLVSLKIIADDSSAHQAGYDAQLYISQNTMIRVYKNGSLVRDDTTNMEAIIKDMLSTLKDEKLEGQVVLDIGTPDIADTSWKLGQRVHIMKSINNLFEQRFARIQRIEYRFDLNEATLFLISDRRPFGISTYQEKLNQQIANLQNENIRQGLDTYTLIPSGVYEQTEEVIETTEEMMVPHDHKGEDEGKGGNLSVQETMLEGSNVSNLAELVEWDEALAHWVPKGGKVTSLRVSCPEDWKIKLSAGYYFNKDGDYTGKTEEEKTVSTGSWKVYLDANGVLTVSSGTLPDNSLYLASIVVDSAGKVSITDKRPFYTLPLLIAKRIQCLASDPPSPVNGEIWLIVP